MKNTIYTTCPDLYGFASISHNKMLGAAQYVLDMTVYAINHADLDSDMEDFLRAERDMANDYLDSIRHYCYKNDIKHFNDESISAEIMCEILADY